MRSMRNPRTSATDGDWIDIPSAAAYAGVPVDVLTAALTDGELCAAASWGNASSTLVHSHDVEAWALQRESRLTLAG